MRISTSASKKHEFERYLATVPEPIANLAAEVASIATSTTSMTSLATALIRYMKGEVEERDLDPTEYANLMRPDVMMIADWAAVAGNVWKSASGYGELLSAAKTWHDELAENADENATYQFPDKTEAELGGGWRIVRVNPENAATEGEIMGHCFARYKDDLEKGKKIGYSLRDPQNRPHVTFDVSSIRWPHESEKKAKERVAKEMAWDLVEEEMEAEVERRMAENPEAGRWVIDQQVRKELTARMERIAEALLLQGKVPDLKIGDLEAKGNSAPPDRYRGILAKFIEDRGFYKGDSSFIKERLTPSDELLNQMRAANTATMLSTAANSIPAAKRQEALDIVLERIDPAEGEWQQDPDDMGNLLSLLSDELTENPENEMARGALIDTLAENPYILQNEELSYHFKTIYKIMGGDRWVISMLESDDPDTVKSGIYVAKDLKLDQDNPAWSRAISNAAVKTFSMKGYEDPEGWAIKMNDLNDPMETLQSMGESFTGELWSNDFAFNDITSPLGREMKDLYRDRPAEVPEYMERIPWQFLDDFRMTGFGLDNGQDKRLLDTSGDKLYDQSDVMNKHLEQMAKDRARRGEKQEELSNRKQLSLFASLISDLEEVDPRLVDRFDKHLMRRNA